ncbi:MAG: tRNA 2-thiouridine(34) synthase MnmA [Bifidobacteriaceae bacterium]|jgi:tRNA-specific 2-thiouridylase|nr:tRNA 2-thiouridine(34) synthase MnmA [Bifidobacteriaceae bacterium]
MKLLSAMSGGVDSSVATALAVKMGHSVTGVHMALMENRQLFNYGLRGCCSIEDSNDAARVAAQLEIPFYVWDLSKDFKNQVVNDFVEQYKMGRTPNPCIRCNEFIKFQTLLQKSISFGFDGLITGHWAQIIDGNLYRAVNLAKDQSYVLAIMSSDILSKCFFPLGEYATKDEIRQLASDFGFEVKDKFESTDICFIKNGETSEFLTNSIGDKTGDIINLSGEVLGQHKGYFHFTIGQRRGLNIKNPAFDGKPRYVLKTNPAANTVTVGTKQNLNVKQIITKISSSHSQIVSSATKPIRCYVQIRAHSTPIKASAEKLKKNGYWKFTLAVPQKDGVADGQTLVAYRKDRTGDKVLGSWEINNGA